MGTAVLQQELQLTSRILSKFMLGDNFVEKYLSALNLFKIINFIIIELLIQR